MTKPKLDSANSTGRGWLSALAGSGLFIVFLVGQLVLFLLRQSESAKDHPEAAATFAIQFGSIFLGGFGAAGILLGIVGMTSNLRTRALRLHNPESIVLTSRRLPELAAQMHHVQRDFEGAAVPHIFSLVAADDGLTLWRGVRVLRLLGRIDWRDVSSIMSSEVREGYRLQPVILVKLGSAGDLHQLPFFVIGRGLGGLLAETPEVLNAAIRDMEIMRELAREGR